MSPLTDREISIDDLTPRLAYKTVVGTSIPRPIAWVSTISKSGVINVAPFSFFTPMGYRPAMFGIAISDTDAGAHKDTLRNIVESKEFVINIAGAPFAAKVHGSGRPFASAVSEAEELGLAMVGSSTIAPPRIAGVPASFECRLVDVAPIPGGSTWVTGVSRVVHVRDDAVDAEFNVDFERFEPLGRLIADAYLVGGEVTRL